MRYSAAVMGTSAARQPACAATDLACVALRPVPWRDPVEVAAPFADEACAAVLLSAGDGWSYVLRAPDAVADLGDEAPGAALPGLLGPLAAIDPNGPPFQGGVIGLASYELSARLEATAPQARDLAWPDLTLMRYPALLAFHAADRRAFAIGRGPTPHAAAGQAARAIAWLQAPPASPVSGALAKDVRLGVSDSDHAAAVAETVRRIAAGEIFQANLARPWRGRLAAGARPFDLFQRLAHQSAAGYAAYLRLPGRALVSNSPERFLTVTPAADGLWAQTHPIKGTRPRGADATTDAVLAAELLTSEKDRAENLMIVDLMRNDLARVSVPGTVSVPRLAALESYANVHHLVSQVRARLKPDVSAWNAFLAAFPPGSVTGAPKLQAMSVIARHEPPRGPYCGSLFWAGIDGALDASVLIRTVAFVEATGSWRFEARAGGGIVADSEPAAEVAETHAKIAAILRALTQAP
jgi:para-aminobenzoate synthetase component 1